MVLPLRRWCCRFAHGAAASLMVLPLRRWCCGFADGAAASVMVLQCYTALVAVSGRGRAVLIGAIIVVLAASAAAQFQRRGGGRFFSPQIRPNPPYDGAFQFCR